MPSIKDVADLAGVKPKTREKVLSAIRQLNYIPNEVARNFKMQKSTMVALLLPSIWHPFFSELAYYIEDELDREGFKLMLCNSGGKPKFGAQIWAHRIKQFIDICTKYGFCEYVIEVRQLNKIT